LGDLGRRFEVVTAREFVGGGAMIRFAALGSTRVATNRGSYASWPTSATRVPHSSQRRKKVRTLVSRSYDELIVWKP
jgi:hypothetical protein